MNYYRSVSCVSTQYGYSVEYFGRVVSIFFPPSNIQETFCMYDICVYLYIVDVQINYLLKWLHRQRTEERFVWTGVPVELYTNNRVRKVVVYSAQVLGSYIRGGAGDNRGNSRRLRNCMYDAIHQGTKYGWRTCHVKRQTEGWCEEKNQKSPARGHINMTYGNKNERRIGCGNVAATYRSRTLRRNRSTTVRERERLAQSSDSL